MSLFCSGRPLAAVAAMMLVAAGCGGGGDDSAANGDSNPAAATASTASSTSTSADPQNGGTRSAGCESSRPEPGESTVTITSGGRERSYLRYIPDGAAESDATPLVLDFPACSPAEMETEFSGFTKPDAEGSASGLVVEARGVSLLEPSGG